MYSLSCINQVFLNLCMAWLSNIVNLGHELHKFIPEVDTLHSSYSNILFWLFSTSFFFPQHHLKSDGRQGWRDASMVKRTYLQRTWFQFLTVIWLPIAINNYGTWGPLLYSSGTEYTWGTHMNVGKHSYRSKYLFCSKKGKETVMK